MLAQQERAHTVTVMDIYDIKMKRHESNHPLHWSFPILVPVPSRAEILLELTEKEIDSSGQKGHVAWLANGLKIQEMQYVFQFTFPELMFLKKYFENDKGYLYKLW